MKDKFEPTTAVGRQFKRLLLGFGVGIVVGAAPFLGTVDVPFFVQLVEVFPDQGRIRLFAFGAFAMSIVAVTIQFYVGELPSSGRIRRIFSRTLACILLAFAVLAVLIVKYVVQKDVGPGETAAFIIAGDRLPECSCSGVSNEECLSELIAHPGIIATCWDSKTAKNVELALLGSYVLLTSGFGCLIGLVILQDAASREAKRRAKQEEADRKKATPPRPRRRKPKGARKPKS